MSGIHVLRIAGGGYNLLTMTNSLESWNYAYSHGTRVFDADLNFTSDGVLVLRHSWDDDLGQENFGKGVVPDYDTFMSGYIFPNQPGGALSPMSAEMMLQFMEEHGDVYVACDAKADSFKIYSCLAELAEKLDAQEILERIIVSCYTPKEKEAALKAGNFKYFAIRYYNNTYYGSFTELIVACKEGDFDVCMVADYFIRDDEEWRVLTDNGIVVWTAVIDDADEWRRLNSLGISGCVTNFLYEDTLK